MPKLRRVFAITGPVGSGKQSLARKLVAGMNVHHINWKAVLRKCNADSFVHDYARVLAGETPVSARLTLELLQAELAVVPEGETVVFTGIPSMTSQVPILRDLGFKEPRIVFLNATDKFCSSRLETHSGGEARQRCSSRIIEEVYRFREIHPILLRECGRVYGSEAVKFVDGMSSPEQVYADMVEIMTA